MTKLLRICNFLGTIYLFLQNYPFLIMQFQAVSRVLEESAREQEVSGAVEKFPEWHRLRQQYCRIRKTALTKQYRDEGYGMYLKYALMPYKTSNILFQITPKNIPCANTSLLADTRLLNTDEAVLTLMKTEDPAML